jgi:hypothetical protein
MILNNKMRRVDQPQGSGMSLHHKFRELTTKSHPDQGIVQFIEAAVGLIFIAACVVMVQILFPGLCVAFMLLPLFHHVPWNKRWIRPLVPLPFILILIGVMLAGMSLFGMQAVFFGYGFHF